MQEEKYSAKSYAVLAAVFVFIALGFYIFYELVSGVCVPAFINTAAKMTVYKNCTESVAAEVLDVENVSTARRINHRTRHGSGYKAVFEYEYNGQQYTVESSDTTQSKIYSIGDTAELRIDPDEPRSFYDPQAYKLPLAGMVLRITAAAAHLICMVLLVKLALKKRREHFGNKPLQEDNA